MKFNLRHVEYMNIAVEYRVSDASRLLSALAGGGIDFLAYRAASRGDKQTIFTLFSEEAHKMREAAEKSGFNADGPYSAILVTGEEQAGALAEVYRRLSQADIYVDESCGIAHIQGGYGIILYVRPEDITKALVALAQESLQDPISGRSAPT